MGVRMKSRMKTRRCVLLSFLGVQLLLVGVFLYQTCSDSASLHLLFRDGPKAGQPPFLAQLSSPEIPLQDVYADLSQIRPVDMQQKDLPDCPVISPYINGPLKVMVPDNLTMEKVAEKNPLVEPGGQYWPPDCWTRHHTAVVVPYYGQAQNLKCLLFHLHPFLQRQQLHYTIYVVTQVNSTAFSRGRLRNVGFWEAMQDEDWDCVFLHDVNVLPEDDRNLYTCDFFPVHVSVAIDRFNYKLPHQGYLGGVLSLRPIHYLRIHGFPSGYQDLEDEDNDIATRVKLSGMYLSRTHLIFGRYHMLEGQDPGRGQSLPRLRVLAHIRRRWRQDSISSLEYRLLSRERHPLFTNLTVDFSFPGLGATELH